MDRISKNWNRLPRPIRTVTILALGALSTLTVERGIGRGSGVINGHTALFPVGIECASDAARVEYSRHGNIVNFYCRDYAGNKLDVMGLGELVQDYSVGGSGYTTVVEVESPEPSDPGSQSAIRFSFEGQDGRAELMTVQELPGDFSNSARLNAIIRVHN